MNTSNEKIIKAHWQLSYAWTISYLELLMEIKDNNQKENREEERENQNKKLKVLMDEREKLISDFEKNQLNSMHVKLYGKALKKLLNSTKIINHPRFMAVNSQPELFEKINFYSFNKKEFNDLIDFVILNLEENWVSFNQSYSRMLFKKLL